MIGSFRHKSLERFWTRSDASGLRPDWIKKINRLLRAVEAAKRPEELMFPGSGFHVLRGDRKGRYAMTVSRNWRITLGWDGEEAIDIDLEDYHG
jgi:proteic killer suppression protein